MKNIHILIIVILFSFSSESIAHKDHGVVHRSGLSQSEIITIARDKIAEQVNADQLDKSWLSVNKIEAVLTRLDEKRLWKVNFKQSNANNSDQLTVIISKLGELISISQ